MQPTLDHYIGRPIEDVNKRSGAWQIVLEGGVRIIVEDDAYEMPDKSVLTDYRINSVATSRGETRLILGNDDNPSATQVNLPPTAYAIYDERYGTDPVRPQATPTAEETRPEEPAERLVEGEPVGASESPSEASEPAGEGEE